jgi:hypothetical protein
MNEQHLPPNYARTCVILMPRDTSWMFCYWEVQPQVLQDNFSHAVIRVYEFNPSLSNGAGERYAFEISVPLESRSWYINTGEPGRAWCVELGLVTPDGRFILLARSNRIRLPRGRVSEVVSDRWVTYHQKLIEVSRAETIGHGSMEITRMLAHRWEMEMKEGISSWSSSWQKGAVSSVKAPPGDKK